MSNEELAFYIAHSMTAVSSHESYATAASHKNRDARFGSIASLVYDSVKACNILRYMNGQVYAFDGCIYVPVIDETFMYAIEHFLKLMSVDTGDISRNIKNFIWKAFQALRMSCPLEPSFHIWAFQNGIVNFNLIDPVTNRPALLPFSPEHHVIHKNSYSYDTKADCPLWKSFLREVLPERESRLTLQMFFGLGLYDRGKMTDKIENCMMLFGQGSNGKSVIYETIKGVCGAPNIAEMPLMALLRGGDEKYRNMAKVDGKIFNYCPEVQARDLSMYSDAFKSLCSGENQYARVLGRDIYTVRNVPWLVFNMNNMPKSTDGSYGFFRRFIYVVFDIVIPDEKQNKRLAHDLKAEYPGILNWMFRGRIYLRERKYQFPVSESSERRKLLNIGESNPVLGWLKIRGIRANSAVTGELSAWIPSQELHRDMLETSKVNGFRDETAVRFGKEMQKYGWNGRTSRKRSAGGILYRVYGISRDMLNKDIPCLLDMEIKTLDEFDKKVEYDPADIN